MPETSANVQQGKIFEGTTLDSNLTPQGSVLGHVFALAELLRDPAPGTVPATAAAWVGVIGTACKEIEAALGAEGRSAAAPFTPGGMEESRKRILAQIDAVQGAVSVLTAERERLQASLSEQLQVPELHGAMTDMNFLWECLQAQALRLDGVARTTDRARSEAETFMQEAEAAAAAGAHALPKRAPEPSNTTPSTARELIRRFAELESKFPNLTSEETGS